MREQSIISRSKVKINNFDPESDAAAKCKTLKDAEMYANNICSFGTASGIVGEDVQLLESQYSLTKRILATAEGLIIEGYKVNERIS